MYGPLQLLWCKHDHVYAVELPVPELLGRPAAMVPMASSVLVSTLVAEVAQPFVNTRLATEAFESSLPVSDLRRTFFGGHVPN